AFEKAIDEWGFTGDADRLVWHGTVAGPDRLRFLGMLARYSGLLTVIELGERREAPDRMGVDRTRRTG
ncbi:MAG: hypothetical protein KDJ16_11005, partial [Hyphomicrobiales bacterium]|nr:hypothetical protein [Hyphomicrobiales bacterium]